MEWNKLAPHLRHLSRKDQERVQEAHELGVTAHHGQKRKSGEPYFTHPNAVAIMLADMGADPDTLIAALLHDTIEDTDLRLDDIDARFGGSVRALIDGVTKLEAEDVAGKPTLDEQTETLRKMFTLMEEDVRIMVIKLVDRLHNMQTIAPLSEERKNLLARETQDIYVKIAERLSMHDLRDELERLCLRVLEPKLLEDLEKLRASNERRGHNVIQSMKLALHKAMQVDMRYEVKTWEKLMEQLHAEHASVTGLSDITVVFFARDEDECYRILGLLHQIWQRETLSFQDFINSPAINGYKGLHTTVILEDGTRVRCKIRTKDMHEYARKGIASRCFDRRAGGVTDYLPWTERIQALSKDTADRSKRFWQSLQSDILGESIVVHGANDLAVSLPEGSTALDGVFYCFQDKALRTESIKVDGREVPFSAPLTHGASLNITLAKRFTVQREWLQWVHTGFAAAKIREALATQSSRKKYEEGKNLLQEMMQEKRRGFIEEFDRKSIKKGLRNLGYESLEDAYIAIADGRLKANEVYESIFEGGANVAAGEVKILDFFLPSLESRDMDLIRLYERYRMYVRNFQLKFHTFRQKWHAQITMVVTQEKQKEMDSRLREMGIRDIRFRRPRASFNFVLGIFVIMALWGLDPVIAHYLIATHDIVAVDMMLIRFWTLTCVSAFLLLLQLSKSNVQQIPLPLRSRSLWLSVALLIAIAYTTYRSLALTMPLHYTIPMTTAGIVMTTIVNRKQKKSLLATWILLLAGIGVLIYGNEGWPAQGILFTLLAVFSFTAFSLVSESYKRKENVAARSAQYFFVLSLLCTLLTLPLIPSATIGELSHSVIARVILFSAFLSGLPYYIYYFYLSHKAIDFVLRYSFLIIFATLAGQLLINQTVLGRTMLAGVLVLAGAILPLLVRKFGTRTA